MTLLVTTLPVRPTGFRTVTLLRVRGDIPCVVLPPTPSRGTPDSYTGLPVFGDTKTRHHSSPESRGSDPRITIIPKRGL